MVPQTSLLEELNSFLSGAYQVLQDQNVARALPSTIIKLIETGKKQIAEPLIERLIAGLEHKKITVLTMTWNGTTCK
jgi:hypothetical protein